MIVEFRDRSKRVPASIFPRGEIRLYVGEGTSRRDVARLHHAREVLKKLSRRGQWDILAGIRDGRLTVEQVVRIADESGLDTLHLEVVDPGAAETLEELTRAFLATIEVDLTRKAYRTSLTRLVEHLGANTPWDRVGRHEVNEFLDDLRARGLAPNTRAADRSAWSSFFTWAMDRDASMAEQEDRAPRLTTHPVRSSKRVHVATTRHRFLTREEFERLLEVAEPPMRTQYLALVYTGMRIGEFVSRRPEDVTPSVVRIDARDGWTPKGWPRYTHGVRNIPVEQGRLMPALEEYRELWAGERAFFVNPRTVRPWSVTRLREQFRRDIEAAGMVYGRAEDDGIVIHTCRHTLASWLAQADVQLMKIAQILGDSLATVAKYYAHLLPKDLDLTVNRVLKWDPMSEQLTGETDE